MTGVSPLPTVAAPDQPATPSDPYGQIVRRLALVQKSNRGAPGYTRWVNRRLGRYLAAAAFKVGLTPNQVTLVSAAFTFVGILLIALLPSKVWTGALVVVLLLTGYALDAADGQLARLRGGGSPAGEWLDHVVDGIKCAALHPAVLIAWYRFFDLDHEVLLLVPIVFGIEASVFYFTIMLTEQLRRSDRGLTSSSRPATDEAAPALRSLIVLPADYGVLALSFALLGFHGAFVVVYTLLMLANVLFWVGATGNWLRQMQALGRPVG